MVNLLLMTSLCLIYPPGQAPKQQHLLFIGNSLTAANDLPRLVQELYVVVKQPKPVVEAITVGGFSLGDHWQNPNTRARIAKGQWDYIILQQGPSSLAESQREFLRAMETIKPMLRQSGGKPALFMVWPDTTRKQFFPQVRQAYANAAKSVDGLFLPAGLALQQIMEKEPGLKLFTDSLHPNSLGTFLAGMVITARLTGGNPDDFPQQITWAKRYNIKLTPREHQAVVNAVKQALRDEGK